MTRDLFPMPPIDVVQKRLVEKRCLSCGGEGLPLDAKTGFPVHYCATCEKAIADHDRRVRKIRESA